MKIYLVENKTLGSDANDEKTATSTSLKRKSELYDPTCPDSDDDTDEENENEDKKQEKEEKSIEPAPKVQKVPIKIAIPSALGKRPDVSSSESEKPATTAKTPPPAVTEKNGSSHEITKSSSSSVRFEFRFSFFMIWEIEKINYTKILKTHPFIKWGENIWEYY